MKHKTRTKTLSIMLSLVLMLSLVPGMSLTAYAAEKSETISLIGEEPEPGQEPVTSVTSEHFKVTAGYNYIGGLGLTVNKFGAMTIESLNGENITKIELSYTWGSNANTVSVTPGTLNVTYNTISDINATKVTVSSSSAAGVRFGSVKIYYSSTDVDVTGVTLSPNTTQTITVGENVAFTATVSPDDATDKKVVWSVSGSGVKLYSNQACTAEVGADATETLTVYAKGESAGSATITATSNADSEKKASCDVTVNAAEPESTYTLTIPSTLNVANSGWNATDGISATGSLASGKKLTVTASSDGEFALVNQSDNTQKVGYKLATASTDTEATTSWEFTDLSSTAATKPMGIIVDDYSSKPAGTYTDTVTFTAKVEDAAVVKTLTVGDVTLDYCDGDTWQQIVDRNPDKIKTTSGSGWEVRISKINGSFTSWNLCKGSTGSNNFVYADHVVDPNATYVWWE